jgi:hypothetical protein
MQFSMILDCPDKFHGIELVGINSRKVKHKQQKEILSKGRSA